MKLILGFMAFLILPFVYHSWEPLLFVLTGIISLTIISSFAMEALQVGRSVEDDGGFTSSASQNGS